MICQKHIFTISTSKISYCCPSVGENMVWRWILFCAFEKSYLSSKKSRKTICPQNLQISAEMENSFEGTSMMPSSWMKSSKL